MLDFYSDLNNARKERDEKYVEESFIGEEIIEPDEINDGSERWAEGGVKNGGGNSHALYDSGSVADVGDLLSELKEEIKQEEGEYDDAGMDLSSGSIKVDVRTSMVLE
jgi:hypothetical protein